jgi:hypothetical protein
MHWLRRPLIAIALVFAVFGIAALALSAASPTYCAAKSATVIGWLLSTPGGWMLADAAFMAPARAWALAGGQACEWRLLLPFALAAALQWSVPALVHGVMLDLLDRAARQ